MKRLLPQASFAALAVILLLLVPLVIPTKWVINVQNIGVNVETRERLLDRRVNIPGGIYGRAFWEIVRGTDAVCTGPETLFFYEERDTPLHFSLPDNCDFSAPGDYLLRYVIRAVGPLGVPFYRSVTTVVFTGAAVEQQQRALQGQIELLQREVETLKGTDR